VCCISLPPAQAKTVDPFSAALSTLRAYARGLCNYELEAGENPGQGICTSAFCCLQYLFASTHAAPNIGTRSTPSGFCNDVGQKENHLSRVLLGSVSAILMWAVFRTAVSKSGPDRVSTLATCCVLRIAHRAPSGSVSTPGVHAGRKGSPEAEPDPFKTNSVHYACWSLEGRFGQ
jgi:hypothetical protein